MFRKNKIAFNFLFSIFSAFLILSVCALSSFAEDAKISPEKTLAEKPETPQSGAKEEKPNQAAAETTQELPVKAEESNTVQTVSKLAAPSIKEPITVNGDTVEYFHEQKMVSGTGNVSILYRDVTLTCDKIMVYLDTREAIAEGNVKITQKGAYFTGDKISYNFDTRKGSVLKGYINAPPFYGQARRLEKAANKDLFKMRRGYVTTCDLDEPHYKIQAKEVKIYLKDKVIAKHILFFIGKVPVLYLPYYEQSLKDTKTHISLIPGQSKSWGYYLLGAYRYHLTDNSRGDLLLDYRSKKGLAGGVNHYYDSREVGDGALKFYYTKENNSLAYEKTGKEKTRYRWQFRHLWDIGHDTDTNVIVEFNKVSDPNVIKDYFYNEFEEIGEVPDNYISIITAKPSYSTELLLRKRFDKYYTVVERLPEYRIDIMNYRIGNTSFYYNGEVDGVYLNQTYKKTDPEQKDVNIIRFDTYNQISYAANIFRSLHVTPYVGMRNTYFSRNKWGDTNLVRTIYDFGVDNSIKFYKVYDVTTNAWGLDLNKVRHVVTPLVNYYYTPQPNISYINLNQFDTIDALNAKNGFYMGIENKIQTKRHVGKELKSVDLATLLITSDYMFRLKRNNLSLKDHTHKFKSVDLQLEVSPYPWAYGLMKVSIDPKRYIVKTYSLDAVLSGEDKWYLGVSHRYETVETGKSSLLTFDSYYKINDQWSIRTYDRFDMLKLAFQEHEFTIAKDLHCWIAEVTYNIKKHNNHSLWFTLRLKAFPEYPIGYKRTYSRPQFGATGIQTPANLADATVPINYSSASQNR